MQSSVRVRIGVRVNDWVRHRVRVGLGLRFKLHSLILQGYFMNCTRRKIMVCLDR